jgi:hypothetical protein
LVLTILFPAVFGVASKTLMAVAVSDGSLTSEESQVTALVNGTEAYNYDLELEKIALRHFAFRSAGSAGANETANWLKAQLESFGLEAWLEPFNFTTWDLAAKPSLLVDLDGNEGTASDQVVISSFQSEHLSWPTPSGGAFAQLVTLPLPAAATADEAATKTIDASVWSTINTTGKIVLTGKEVLGSSSFLPRAPASWRSTFLNKLWVEPPVAVVYTCWYSWNAFIPSFFGSSAGHASLGLHVPSGSVNYQDGLYMRDLLDTVNPSACVVVDSAVGNGTHYNVVGRIRGSGNPNKTIIISSHYDTVMTAGFGDNGGGTAGVLELAKVFSDAARRGLYSANYTLLFVAFAAEEFWLVGSANYVKQHKSEMANISAVINLDCIGNDDASVTQTSTVDGFNLGQTILSAASDLGIDATLEPPEDSDHAAFLNPARVENVISNLWDFAGISDALPVESSAMIISSPILPGDKWSGGTPGWIHTSYDNSTSTQTLGWVKPVKLEEQIKVAGLSVMRVQEGTTPGTAYFPWQILVLVAIVVIVAAITVHFVRARRKPSEENKPGNPEPRL